MSQQDQRTDDGHPLKPTSVREIERNAVSSLSQIEAELELEERELDRIYSLGFSGDEFEEYRRKLEERINELAIAAEHTARIIKRTSHEQKERSNQEGHHDGGS